MISLADLHRDARVAEASVVRLAISSGEMVAFRENLGRCGGGGLVYARRASGDSAWCLTSRRSEFDLVSGREGFDCGLDARHSVDPVAAELAAVVDDHED